MQSFICVACGTQFSPSASPPAQCPICVDERQYVPRAGQRWAVMPDLQRHFENELLRVDDGLFAVVTRPQFAIGQRAYLVQTPEGNVLWDCISLVDPDTVSSIWAHGGVAAIAISHPHYYSSMAAWSQAFGGIPIYLHESDRQWVQYPGAAIEYWTGESKPLPGGLRLIRCGGHFEGGTVLHWPAGADGRGALLTGDVLQVCPDRKHFGFMYSYPNYIPLPPDAVRTIAATLEPYPFDVAFGAFGNIIEQDASGALVRSAHRYLRAIGQPLH
jgi:DNA-directed RNA polymerase subunit RPC12/RpoP